jgi:hypothetical protein
MSASQLKMTVFSVADLRRPGALRALGAELDRHAELRPTRIDTKDPVRAAAPSAADALGQGEGLLTPGKMQWWFLARPEKPRLSGGSLRVADGDAVSEFGASWDAKWFDRPERLDLLGALLAGVADAMRAMYGRVALDDMYTQRNQALDKTRVEPGRFGARLKADFGRELPDVYWLNFFGPGFVEHWGARLDSLGVRRDRTATGGLVVWSTPTPFVHDPLIAATSDYEFKRPFYDALGFDTFMSETQRRPEPGELVPTLEVHRRLAGAAA